MIFENITVKSTLLDRIKETQKKDPVEQKLMENVQKGELPDFNLSPEKILRYQNRVVVPKDETLKKKFWRKFIGPSIRSIRVVVRYIRI